MATTSSGDAFGVAEPLHLDTHVVVWLYAGEHHRFPVTLRARLGREQLRISPMVRLELTYLNEIGRVKETAERILGELTSSLGLIEASQSFQRVVDLANRTGFTRDPFDRIILSQALAAKTQLATKDERMREAYPDDTVWD